MVFEDNGHVAVVKRRANLSDQFLKLSVGDIVFLIEDLKLRQIFIVDGVPIESALFLKVPPRVILVESVPQYLELLGKAGVGLTESHLVEVVVGHQTVALATTRRYEHHEEHCSQNHYLILFHDYVLLPIRKYS